MIGSKSESFGMAAQVGPRYGLEVICNERQESRRTPALARWQQSWDQAKTGLSISTICGLTLIFW